MITSLPKNWQQDVDIPGIRTPGGDHEDFILVREDDIWIIRVYEDASAEVVLYCELNGDYSFDARKFARTLYKRIIKAHVI